MRKQKAYKTVGVRFIGGPALRTYTYRVRRGAKPYLGQELIADTAHGPTLVVVVRVDKVPQDTGSFDYKTIERKTVPL